MIYNWNGIFIFDDDTQARGDIYTLANVKLLSSKMKIELIINNEVKDESILVFKVTPQIDNNVYEIIGNSLRIKRGAFDLPTEEHRDLLHEILKNIISSSFKETLIEPSIEKYIERKLETRELAQQYYSTSVSNQEYIIANEYKFQHNETDELSFALPTKQQIEQDMALAGVDDNIDTDDDSGIVEQGDTSLVSIYSAVDLSKVANPYKQIDSIISEANAEVLRAYITPYIYNAFLDNKMTDAYEYAAHFIKLVKDFYCSGKLTNKFDNINKTKMQDRALVQFVTTSDIFTYEDYFGHSNTELELYPNELKMYEDLCEFFKKNLKEDFLEDYYKKGILSDYCHEFFEDIIYSIVEDRYQYAGASLKIEKATEEEVGYSQDVLLKEHGDVVSLLEYIKSCAKALGSQVYAEAIIKLLRWGSRKPATLNIKNITSSTFNLVNFRTERLTNNAMREFNTDELGRTHFVYSFIKDTDNRIVGVQLCSSYTDAESGADKFVFESWSIYDLLKEKILVDDLIFDENIFENTILVPYKQNMSSESYLGEFMLDFEQKFWNSTASKLPTLFNIILGYKLYQGKTDFNNQSLPKDILATNALNYVCKVLDEYTITVPKSLTDEESLSYIKEEIFKLDESAIESKLNLLFNSESTEPLKGSVSKTSMFTDSAVEEKESVEIMTEAIQYGKFIETDGSKLTWQKVMFKKASEVELFLITKDETNSVVIAPLSAAKDLTISTQQMTLMNVSLVVISSLLNGTIKCHGGTDANKIISQDISTAINKING